MNNLQLKQMTLATVGNCCVDSDAAAVEANTAAAVWPPADCTTWRGFLAVCCTDCNCRI